MTVQHKHLIIRATINKPPNHNDINTLTDWIRKVIRSIDMKILGGPYTTYCDIKGMTSVTIIETSHIVLHVWDEQSPGLFQLDVYSCKSFDLNIVLSCLKDSFNITKLQYKSIDLLAS